MPTRNLSLISLNYFTQGIFNTFISTYLTIYLLYNTSLSRGDISILLFIAPLPLLFRPWFGKVMDHSINVRFFFLFGILLYIFSLISMGLITTITNLWGKLTPIFGSYLGISIFDSIGDKYMTTQAKGDAASSAIWMSLSQTVARTLITLVFTGLIGSTLNSSSWALLFIIMGLTSIPLAIFGMVKYPVYLISDLPIQPSNIEHVPMTKEMKRIIRYIILFAIVLNIKVLADYMYEPYLVTKFGAESFVQYGYYIAFSPYLSFIVYPLIYHFKTRFMAHRLTWIIIAGTFSLIFWIVLAGNSFTSILILTVLSPIFSTILYVAYISIFIDGSPILKEGFYYQLYSTAYWIANIIFGAVGMALTQWLRGEIILLITGFLLFSGLFVVPKINLEIFQPSLNELSQAEIKGEY